jgi:hypothetical protein
MGRVLFTMGMKALARAATGYQAQGLNQRGFLATTWAKLFQAS